MRQKRGLRVVRAVGLAMLTAVISVGAFSPVGTEALRGPVVGQPAPDITGGPWINSEPLSLAGLRGRVVLVEFWTYG
jgi:hypothetical protein